MSNIIDPERRQKVIDGLARGESVRSIALTVGFVAALGTFVTQSHAALTVRAA